MTTWKIIGVARANSCSASEAASTSPSIQRYLTRAGMNQVTSNLADASPATRVVMKTALPDHSCWNASNVRAVGASAGRWIKTWSSRKAPTRKYRPRRSRTIAGRGEFSSAAMSRVAVLALAPTRLARRTRSASSAGAA